MAPVWVAPQIINESILEAADIMSWSGNQLISATQAVVNMNPNAKTTNGMY
jgi:hypothetical protein